MPSDAGSESGTRRSLYNPRALCVTPNPTYRQSVGYCTRLHRENPDEKPPTTFQADDPNVVN